MHLPCAAQTQTGLPLVESAAPGAAETKRVHVFSNDFVELQGEGYEAVAFARPLVALTASTLRGWLPSWAGGGNSA